MPPLGNAVRASRRVLGNLLSHPGSRGSRRVLSLARFALWQLNKRTVRAAPTLPVYGHKARMRAYPDSQAASGLIYFGYPDWLEMRLLEKFLRPGDTFVDVGANIGTYSVLAHTCVAPHGTIVAFEPDPRIVARLRENFQLNGMDTARIHAVAVSNENTRVAFCAADSVGAVVQSSHHSRDVQHVSAVKLDTALLDSIGDIAAMKIDIEGHELSALHGASELLDGGVGLIMLETNQCASHDERRELQSFLSSKDYALFSVEDDEPTLCALSAPSSYPHNAVAIRDMARFRARVPSAKLTTSGGSLA
ncbi:MAG: FkbM family methyltransferase [Microcella sp.]|uniref:FkbM family methyltransferase n=1 Tax=Microcella sp. TaxID=1913979 RepID=UPI003315683F